jgi:hypothetical protein
MLHIFLYLYSDNSIFIAYKTPNMLEKTKVLFIIIPLALYIVSCNKAETTKPKAEASQTSEPSSKATKPKIMLNVGDLTDIDKLLLQVNRATQKSKDLVAADLKWGKIEMEKERKKGLHGGRSGLTKLFCVSPMYYPTVGGLTNCAEAVSLDQANFEGKLKNFKSSSKLYQTALLFSERTNTPLTSTERQKVEKDIACLDAFVKAPNPEAPGCELVRVSLLDPALPGGKILPSPIRKQ